VREYVITAGASADDVSMLPNAVDVDRFHPDVEAAPMPWAHEDFVVGFVGSLKPWHGVDSLLRAFARLHRADPRYRLLVVGDGPLRSWIEGFACGAGIEDRITVTGWVANDRLPGLVKRMHVTVAPYPDLENFYFSPLKLFEYMAMARPVVASDVGQVGDLIRDGREGLLTPPGDEDAMVSQVSRLREDEPLRRRIGAGALRRARAWTWNDSARRVIDLVGNVRRAA
jgi:glycosyltransferase involved in cell wall biosynthesis